MCRSMVDIQSAAAEIRRGKKEDRRKKPQGKNIMSASATQGGHKYALAPVDKLLISLTVTHCLRSCALFSMVIRIYLAATSCVELVTCLPWAA